MNDPSQVVAYKSLLDERRRLLQRELDASLGSRREFVWEIGCGHGHFLTEYARVHPAQYCIGIDIATDRIERALRKRDRAQLSNLMFIQAEARLFLETLDPAIRLSSVFILFPDPWPKMRHWKHRLVQADFLRKMAARTAPNASLYFRTDYQPYFNEVDSVVSKSGWVKTSDPWPFEFETVFQARAASGFYSLIAQPIQSALISSVPQ